MAKRSHPHQIDIVSETQQNSKWLWGRRRNTSWSEMTPAEWSRFRRSLPLQNKILLFSFLVAGILMAIESFISISSQGLSISSGIEVLITAVIWAWILIAWRKSTTR